ncbi:hypothetical protein GW829_03640 [bacterium]|nr:hypothetical protein [bacterium]
MPIPGVAAEACGNKVVGVITGAVDARCVQADALIARNTKTNKRTNLLDFMFSSKQRDGE